MVMKSSIGSKGKRGEFLRSALGSWVRDEKRSEPEGPDRLVNNAGCGDQAQLMRPKECGSSMSG